MNTMTPIAFSVQRCEFTDTLVCLYPWRVDWFGYQPLAYKMYHLACFDCAHGASEGVIATPEIFWTVIGRAEAEALFESETGERIPEEAFEGRVA